MGFHIGTVLWALLESMRMCMRMGRCMQMWVYIYVDAEVDMCIQVYRYINEHIPNQTCTCVYMRR